MWLKICKWCSSKKKAKVVQKLQFMAQDKSSIPTFGLGMPQQWQLKNGNLAGNLGAWKRSCSHKPPNLLTRVMLQTHTTSSPFTAPFQPKGFLREVQSPAHHCCWESPSSATLGSGVGGCLFRSSSSCCRRTSSSSSWERKHSLFKNTAHFSWGVLQTNNNSMFFWNITDIKANGDKTGRHWPLQAFVALNLSGRASASDPLTAAHHWPCLFSNSFY